MKINILVENLRKGLSIAMRGVSSRAQLPVLSMLLLRAGKEGLVILATDLELSFRVSVRAKVEEEGEMAIPAKLFAELIATLSPGVVELFSEKQTLIIKGEKIKAEVVGQGSEEFPSLPMAKGKGLVLSVEELREKIERVGIAAARDDSRPVLAGMLWVLFPDKVILVATDGYRLGMDTLKEGLIGHLEASDKFILPVRALLELSRVLEPSMKSVEVEFDRDKQQVIFSTENLEMTSRLIAGVFPPYEKVIPVEERITIELEKDALVEAVKRASLFARENANVVRLSIEDEEVIVTAQSDQVGGSQSVLEARVEGEAGFKIAFNAKYLLDYLGAIKGDKVKIETEGELKPVVFRESNDFVHVIMPVRTQS